MNIFSKVKDIFGFKGVGESAIRIVDRLAGTDWTPQQQSDFILKHAEVTKYQSPTRRAIALVLLFEWSLMVNLWLFFRIYGAIKHSAASTLLSADISAFMVSNINVGFSGLLAFYFIIGTRK